METALGQILTASHVGVGLPDDDLLTSKGVRQKLGNISHMTLWRYSKNLRFPPPDKVINRIRFWRRDTVQRWVDSQPESART
jgi:predicted DNA-binding transcriptional regulator AlpA